MARSRERLSAERAWQDFGARSGVAVAILRLAGIYGPDRNALVQVARGDARRIVKPGQVFNRIHVEDIASAHVDALTYLRSGGASITLNVGYGHGYSVRQVLASVERISGKPLKVREAPRRPGDPPVLVARADRIRSELGWQPRHDDLDSIVRSAYAWEQRLLREPW